ncbi:multiple epidermal growth factor-like domains protein 10 [Asterias rubens]|uniref:multiple epidermal growth factor-like domains protein 10 n=1 Tax=Asterias rubens TaxID=7604 RepID=UPI0014553456|nr:multiple epidermal growth factor-like domains protein 10 [Asterias rubens]
MLYQTVVTVCCCLIAVNLQSCDARTCSRRVRYRIYERVSVRRSRQQRYTTRCELFGWKRCSRYRATYSTGYETDYSYTSYTSYYCCNGWRGGGCSQPI